MNCQFFRVSEDVDDGFYSPEDIVAIESIGHILDNSIDHIDSENYYLPEFLRCCSHTLDLVVQRR